MSHSCAMPHGTGDLGLPVFWYEIRTKPVSSGYQLNIRENTIVSIQLALAPERSILNASSFRLDSQASLRLQWRLAEKEPKAQLFLHLICWDWGTSPSIATNTGWFLPSLSASFSLATAHPSSICCQHGISISEAPCLKFPQSFLLLLMVKEGELGSACSWQANPYPLLLV